MVRRIILKEFFLFARESTVFHAYRSRTSIDLLSERWRLFCLFILAEYTRHAVEEDEPVLVWALKLVDEALANTRALHVLQS